MKILVTGANGYLGQGVVKALLDNGHSVVAADFKTNYVDDRAEKMDCDLFSVENTDVSGIVLRFYNMFLGKPMMHGGMYPWKKLSVYKAGIGNIEDF